MKLSARNELKGKIVNVKKGVTASHVRIDVGCQVVTAAITNELVEDLKLAVGQTAYSVIQGQRCNGGDRLSMWRSSLTTAALLTTLLAPANAAEDGCGKFAWPLAREQALFARADKPAMKAGETLSDIPKTAFVLLLKSGAEATFAMPPERKPKSEHWFGGAIRFPALEKPGIYQVTLSDEAWIDVVQDDRYARALGSTGRSDCLGLRKSVRLDLSASPFVLQLSGVSSDEIAVAISSSE